MLTLSCGRSRSFIAAIVTVSGIEHRSPLETGDAARRFTKGAMEDVSNRARDHFGCAVQSAESPAEAAKIAAEAGASQLVTMRAPAGPMVANRLALRPVSSNTSVLSMPKPARWSRTQWISGRLLSRLTVGKAISRSRIGRVPRLTAAAPYCGGRRRATPVHARDRASGSGRGGGDYEHARCGVPRDKPPARQVIAGAGIRIIAFARDEWLHRGQRSPARLPRNRTDNRLQGRP